MKNMTLETQQPHNLVHLLNTQPTGVPMTTKTNTFVNGIVKPLSFLIASTILSTSALAGNLSKISRASDNSSASKMSQSEIEELKQNSISFRQQGDTIRFRYLTEKNQSKPINDLKSRTNPVFENQKITVMGPASTGGGFTNYRGSMRNLKSLLQSMIEKLEQTSDWYFKSTLPPNLQNRLDRTKIIAALKTVRYSYFQSGLAVAPDRSVDELEADYEVTSTESHIILLKKFFDSFTHQDDMSERVSKARTIFHEITHLVGIGVRNDDESYITSLYLTRLFVDYPVYCGASNGNIAKGVQDCLKVSMTPYQNVKASEESYIKWSTVTEVTKAYPEKTILRMFNLQFNQPEKLVFESLLPENWTRKQADDFLNGDRFVVVDYSYQRFLPEAINTLFLDNNRIVTNSISSYPSYNRGVDPYLPSQANGYYNTISSQDCADPNFQAILDRECSRLNNFDLLGKPKSWKAEVQMCDTKASAPDDKFRFVCTTPL
jgi:hypothetical protein